MSKILRQASGGRMKIGLVIIIHLSCLAAGAVRRVSLETG
jgi:hypothetical protein